MDNKFLPDNVVELELQGKFAHFRKFYTNASSLTYLIPPRTTVCGMLASVMLIERDAYYDLLNSRNLMVAIAVGKGTQFTRSFQTMNYVSDNAECVNDVSVHKQCRLELLTSSQNTMVSYRIWIGIKESVPDLVNLIEKIRDHDLGFGVYLGQRQFRADLRLISEFMPEQFEYIPESEYLDSAILKIQAEPIFSGNEKLVMEKMQLEQTLVTDDKTPYRQNRRIGDVLFESSGDRMYGKFRDCIRLKNTEETVIAFL